MPLRRQPARRESTTAVTALRTLAAAVSFAAMLTVTLTACAPDPATRVPYKPVPAERIVKPGYTEPGPNRIAVDVRRERTDNVIVRFRDALVYVDGVQVTDLMNGEHVTFYLTPGPHRIAVSTQFDPVIELPFPVDPRYTNFASVTFGKDDRIGLKRVPH
jgi:hypothetical protein